MKENIVITGADGRYFPFMRDCVMSFLASGGQEIADLGVLDFGLEESQIDWVRTQGLDIVAPGNDLRLPGRYANAWPRHLTCRPFLPKYFPGYAAHLWLDSDAWVQDVEGIRSFFSGARRRGAAMAVERHPDYRTSLQLLAWQFKHLILAFGPLDGLALGLKPHINAGIFAASRDSELWEVWRDVFQRVVDRTGTVAPYDQMALNYAVYRGGCQAELLSPRCNWICDKGALAWDGERGKFCEASPPHEVIAILHLAGATKRSEALVRDLARGRRRISLRYNQQDAECT